MNNETITETVLNKKCIIRTYSAGVWFGTVKTKEKNEIILENARRLWFWKTKTSISLSSVAIHGVNEDASKICEAVQEVWLQPIEIIPCTPEAITSIEQTSICEAS
jgi:hypothetical protein